VDIEQARFNMIEQQIRPWDVLDPKVLEVLRKAPRERYVPDAYRNLAFADIQIPIGHGEVMMEPKVEARLLQELELEGGKVLEVGTGSGYMTALLSNLADTVVSVEIHGDLSNNAAAKLSSAGITNVHLEIGDASKGWPAGGSFDAIVLTGSVPTIPTGFIEILKSGGRLVAIVGSEPMMEAVRLEKTGDGVSRTSLFDTVLPPLVNASAPKQFVF
jgi:protein-L-isoaspartate(D-aspartate) O-methyltransferase